MRRRECLLQQTLETLKEFLVQEFENGTDDEKAMVNCDEPKVNKAMFKQIFEKKAS